MIDDQITARLYVFIRENIKGGCKKFSIGDKCECPLCDLDRLLDALQAMERVPMTRVERRSAFLALDNPSSYDDFMTGLDTAEAHHGITPPESI